MRANYNVNATPQFRVLSDDQIEEIFHAALDVLERVGTQILEDEGLALLHAAGCSVSDEGLVRIPSWLVKQALNTAPRRIVVAGRDRRKRVYLEKDKIHFGTGSDCPNLIDPYTDEVRNYTYQDVYNAARISDALPHQFQRERAVLVSGGDHDGQQRVGLANRAMGLHSFFRGIRVGR